MSKEWGSGSESKLTAAFFQCRLPCLKVSKKIQDCQLRKEKKNLLNQFPITTGWDGWGRPIVAAGANTPAPATTPPQEPPAPLPQPHAHDTPLAAQPSGMGGRTYGYPTQSGSQTSTLMSKTATGRPDQYVGWRNYYLVSKNSDRNDPRGF